MSDDPKPEVDLGQLAWDIVAGQVFGSWMLDGDPDLLRMIFLPLALMDAEGLGKMKAADVVFLYEYLDQAGPRSVNGYPCFMSFKTLTRDQAKALTPKIDEAKAARTKVTGKPA